MASENTSGSQTASIGTEHTLATVTDAASLVLAVDLSNLVNGDEVELRAKPKVRTGSTAAQAVLAVYAHAQTNPVVYLVPVPSPHSTAFTLKQVAGTGRSFDWAVYEL